MLAAPANAERLREEGIDDVGSLIRGYLIEGKPAFRLRETPTVAQAIDAIHDAGGVAVWAHPFWDISDPDEVLASIDRFHALGIDGVEAFYITHTREQTELLAERCAELGLLTTGSADFHGPDNRQFSRSSRSRPTASSPTSARSPQRLDRGGSADRPRAGLTGSSLQP